MRALVLFLFLTCCREQASTPPSTTPTPSLALATAAPPAAVLSQPSYDRSCKEDSECTPAPSCCVAPCSSDVINARELNRARDALHCDPAVTCPVAGGCPTFAYLCIHEACQIAFEGSPGFRKREARP